MPVFTGDDFDNTLPGSLAADTLIGLGGNDTYIVNDIGDQIVESAGPTSGTELIETSVVDDDRLYSLGWWANVENLRFTGTGAAQLLGTAANNLIEANAALAFDDTLSGGAGDDVLRGWDGRDLLIGGAGADYLDGGLGNDTMTGGTGDDTYVINAAGDRVIEFSGGGIDTIRSNVLFDLGAGWTSAVENLTYTGSTARALVGNGLGNLILSLSGSADSLYGGAGNDTLDGGGGADLLTGGSGNDTYLASVADQIVEFSGGGIDRVIGSVTDIGIGALAEVMEGLIYTGAGNVALSGNGLANDIGGGDGKNTISGGDRGDRLFGGAGADLLYGGLGDDTLAGGLLSGTDFAAAPVADTWRDEMRGGDGNDRYIITDSRDLVVELAGEGDLDVLWSYVDLSLRGAAGIEALVLAPGASAWMARGSGADDILVGNQGDNFVDGRTGNDVLSGWAGTAGTGEDVLNGGDGNDVLLAYDFAPSPGGGTVAMLGGAGDDLYVVGTAAGCAIQDSGGSDTVYVVANGTLLGTDGVERIVLAGGDAALEAEAAAAVATVLAVTGGGSFGGFGPVTSVTGTDNGNLIEGNDLANTMDGAGGADTLWGRNGSDILTGGSGGDQVFGDTDNDTLSGGLDNDTLTGGTGDDAMFGGDGSDILSSDPGLQSGNPFVRGGDVMWGDDPSDPSATGADQFRFAAVSAANAAVETAPGTGIFYFNCGSAVGDFLSGTDSLRLAASMVGDNDSLLENVQVVVGVGGFSTASEMVIFRTDVDYSSFDGVIDASAITDVIGSASAAYATGAERIFVVDNGFGSAIFAFRSSNADALVTVDELYFVGDVSGVTTLASGDFALF